MEEIVNKPVGNRPLRVVCLGGGWVALSLARALRPAIRQGKVELVVVSRDSYQTTHGMIAEMLTCKVQPQHILQPLRPLLKPAQLANLEIVGIETADKKVLCRHPLDGSPVSLTYDHLVLGVGSIQDPCRYPGLREHTFSVKTYPECCRLRTHLLSMLERASLETDPDERRRLLTFVVAGGNYAGIEIACDLADYFRLLIRTEFSGIPREAIRVIVAEIGPRILAEMGARHPGLIPYAQRRVAALDLDVRLGAGIACADRDHVTLTNGDVIPTCTIINCTGTIGSPLLDRLGLPQDARGRIVTDAFHRVGDAGDLWAAGDCAAVPHARGGTCPPLALYAQTGGANIGVNILRTLDKKPLETYRFIGLGEACTLGHRCAVASLKGIPTYGWFAWLGWRAALWLLFVPGWRRKSRLALDWLQTAFLGRDTVRPREGEKIP